ncbi:tyrosine-type recombinase/integrase [Actinomadura syzygii]|nr:tyrosine-type recombinase/integrase [Actinomadura syzygii]
MWNPQNTDTATPGKIIFRGGAPDSGTGAGLTLAGLGGPNAAIEIWLRAYTSPNTRDAYRRDVGRWFTWCYDYGIEVADARRGDVDAYRAELDDHDPPLAARTRRRRLAAISSFYAYWLIEDVLPRNPAAHVRRPRPPDEPSSIALTRSQAVALIGAADNDGLRSAIVTRLLLETGMRVSELCGADADDLASTSGHRTLDIVRKGGKTATLPITPATAHLIDRYLNGRAEGPLLRSSGAKSDGVPQPLDRGYVRHLLRRMALEAGLPHEVCEAMHPHVLRHTVATLLDEENIPVQEIQRLLGHTDPRTTQSYIDKRKNLDASPVYIMGRLLART